MRRSTAVLLFLVFAAFVHMAIVYPGLPEAVPTHFGTGGEPDAWSSRTGAIATYAGIVVFTAGFCFGLARLLPRIPDALVNLPHKDYWLAPERRDETHRLLFDVLVNLGSATVALVIATMALAFRVALGQSPGLGTWFWIVLGAYLLYTLGLIPWLLKRFQPPPPT